MDYQFHKTIRQAIVSAFLFVVLTILLMACSNGANQIAAIGSPEIDQAEIVIQQTAQPAVLITPVPTVELDQFPMFYHVSLTDKGPQPQHLYIPAYKNVRIVLRNRTRTEQHYRVAGLIPDHLTWLAVPEDEMEREEGVSDEEHDTHHDKDFVSWRTKSPSGIRPLGDEVHGYATIGEKDVINFVATNLGTFDVFDPLHPEYSAKLTVFPPVE